MGCYSFYKILKDMIRTLLGRKCLKFIIFILLGTFILFFLDRKGVFAFDSNVTLDISNYQLIIDSTNEKLSYGSGNTFYDSLNTSIWDYDNILISYRPNASSFSIYCCNGNFIFDYYASVSDYRLSASNGNLHWVSPFVSQPVRFPNDTINLNSTSFRSLSSDWLDIVLYSSGDILDANGNVVFNGGNINFPEILTSSQDLSSLFFDVLRINAKDYSKEDLYLLCYDKNYENTDSLKNLYPVNEFLLNQQSKYFIPERTTNSETDAIYWINRDEIGFNWGIGNTYSFRFAIRQPIENDFSDWQYEYLGQEISFTISTNVLQSQIDDLNAQTKETAEKERQQETINSINNLNNNLFSNNYDEDKPNDTLNDLISAADDIDETQYIGLFTAIFSKFSNIINGDFSTVEEISYPVFNTNKSIVITSDLLSSKIQGTFIYVFLQVFWYFLFGMYIFKFSNNLIIKIKDGTILNGYENNNEVITSTML